MAVRKTVCLTDRHYRFLADKVEQGAFASRSEAVWAAVERMIGDEEEREMALGASVDHIRSRLRTLRS